MKTSLSLLLLVTAKHTESYWNIFVPTGNHISLSKKKEARAYRNIFYIVAAFIILN